MPYEPQTCPDRHAGCAANVTALREAQKRVVELSKEVECLTMDQPPKEIACTVSGAATSGSKGETTRPKPAATGDVDPPTGTGPENNR